MERILRDLDSVPSLPTMVIELLNLTSSSEATFADIVRVIEADPGVTTRILRLARRLCGHEIKIDTIRTAVSQLGFDAVRNAVLAMKIVDVFKTPDAVSSTDAAPRFDRNALWQHCLGVACAAELLAQQTKGAVHPEEAFIAGLLHDIGKLALDYVAPGSFAKAAARSRKDRCCPTESERAYLGIDHCEAGRVLAKQWELPETIVLTAWLHHHHTRAVPDDMEHGPMIGLIRLADATTRQQRIGDSGNGSPIANCLELAKEVGLDQSAYESALRKLGQRIEAKSPLIGMEPTEVGDLYRQALERANEELGRVNQQLIRSTRRLELRSRLFRALANLNQKVAPESTPSEIGLAVAETACLGLTASASLCIAGVAEKGPLELAYWTTSEADTDTSENSEIEWLIEGINRRVPVLTPIGWSTSALEERSRKNGRTHRFVSKIFKRTSGDSLWALPMVRSSQPVGLLLLAGRGDVLRNWHTQTGELEALSATLGLTIAWSRAKRSADDLAEDLSHKNRALIETHQELLQVQSLRQLAEMAEGAAHELNTPLANISARADHLAGRTEDDNVRNILQTIGDQAHKASGIVSAIREFACPRRPDLIEVHVPSAIETVVADVLQAHGLDGTAVQTEIDPRLPSLKADREQFYSTLREVLDNSFQACVDRSPLVKISAERRADGDGLRMVISDNGVGMPREVLSKATSPFYSHKSAGRRRGLGLSRSSRWVEQHGGRLVIESRPGKGATVKIDWPTEPGPTDSISHGTGAGSAGPDLRLVFPE
jgi:putative nucleotidyltransferase with HDIG domain